MATGQVPGAIYPTPSTKVDPFMPNKFAPPAFWGKYPPYGAPQTSVINTNKPWFSIPWEAGPGYGFNGGQHVGLINANPAVPLAPQPPDTPA